MENGIRKELDRVLASSGFRRCVQLSRFLRFSVDQALAGADGVAKETLIGVEIFGRRPDYDPGSDPVVRVEARRLRLKLEQYYQQEGREDPIRIALPKGGYLPAFQVREECRELASMAVLPFSCERPLERLADGLAARLMARLAGCNRWRMVSSTSAFQFKNRLQDARKIGRELDAGLLVEGSLRGTSRRLRCDAHLISSGDGLHLWAGSFESDRRDRFEMEDEFAARIAEGIAGVS